MPEWNKVQDSGDRSEWGTGAVRDMRTGKGRYDLIPAVAMHRLARHFENGAVKYGDRNFEKGMPLHAYLDSAIRHAFKLLSGSVDEDHAAAIMWNAAAFIFTQDAIERGVLPKELDDLPRNHSLRLSKEPEKGVELCRADIQRRLLSAAGRADGDIEEKER